MKYALERMDHLIRIVLQPREATDLDPVTAAQWIEMTAQEKENVVAYLVHKALSAGRSEDFAVVVRHYQGMVSQLMDFVYAQRHRNTSATFKQFVRKVLEHLEELLLQIKERYHDYFNRGAKVPELHLQKALHLLRKEWVAIEKKLEHLIGDEDLSRVVFHELPALLEEERVWRYCDLSYARNLLRELGRFKDTAKGSADDALWHLLVYYNFNRDAFVQYLNQKIERDIIELSGTAKARRLGFWLKQINQQATATFVGPKPKSLSVKETMNNWLSQEIYWEEHQIRSGEKSGVPTELSTEAMRLHFGVSVEILTLLTRAAKDTGLIVNEHLTEVFKVLSQTCRTTYQEKPSAHSMLKKSYVAERGSKQSAVDILHEMIKRIHKY